MMISQIYKVLGFLSWLMIDTEMISDMDVTSSMYTRKLAMKNPCFMWYSNIVSSSWKN